MKRILIIVGILIAAAAIVVVGMLLRGGGSAPGTGPQGSLPNTPGTLPITGTGDTGTGPTGNTGTPGTGTNGLPSGAVSAVAQAAVLDYVVGPSGVTFIATNGAVISPSSSEAISQASFDTILGAWFSPDGRWLLVKSGSDNYSPSWDLLDVSKKTWRNLQTNTSEMAWSPNGQLAYLARRTNGSTLTTYIPATNATRALLPLSAPDLAVRWKDNSHIFLLDRPSSRVASTVWDFAAQSGTMVPFASNASGADIIWGGPTSGGLLFRAGLTGGTLSIVKDDGSTVQNTSFLTLPSKCVFGETAPTSTIAGIQSYLFCAIPDNQPAIKEKQLPDDYLKGKFGTADALYAIGLYNGKLTQVLPASQSFGFSAENLKVYGDSIYFVNRNDKKLYRVVLSALSGPAPVE